MDEKDRQSNVYSMPLKNVFGVPHPEGDAYPGSLAGLPGTYTGVYGSAITYTPIHTNKDVDWNQWVWSFRIDGSGYIEATATCRECGDIVIFTTSLGMHIPSHLATHKCNNAVILIPGK